MNENEKVKEIEEIMKWFAGNIQNIDLVDQLKVAMAHAEFVEKIKPIYLKYKQKEEGPMDFLFRL